LVTALASQELQLLQRSKEKWLLQIASWGTMALVAFLWWELSSVFRHVKEYEHLLCVHPLGDLACLHVKDSIFELPG